MRQPGPHDDLAQSSGRARVMLVDADPMRRLSLVAGLRESFSVLPVEEGADLLKEVRAKRPDLVLVAMDPSRLAESLRSARVIRSDPTPPLLGLVGALRRSPSPDELLERSLANGVLLGRPEPAQLNQWVTRILAGERAVLHLERGRGLLSKLLGRR